MKRNLLIALFVSVFVFTTKSQEQEIIQPEMSALLEKIYNRDQDVRIELDSVFAKFGPKSVEVRDAFKIMNRTDSINQILLDSIFEKCGWLRYPSVTEKASKAFFYVIQHAPYEFQRKYKDEVSKSFEHRGIDSAEYMMFYDRFSLREGKYQTFGTQIYRDNIGNEYFIPIDTSFHKKLELDGQGKGSFILYSNPSMMALIVHAFEKVSNKGIANIQVFLEGKEIGTTNDTGLFQILIPRIDEDRVLKVVGVENKSKEIILKANKDIDFYDQYIAF